MKIKKFVVGVRLANKMFRATSLAGAVVDSVLNLRGTKHITDDYFDKVARPTDASSVTLQSASGDRVFTLDTEQVVLTKHCYGSDKSVSLDDALQEFRELWDAANAVLGMKKVRRIGMVAEHRFNVEKKDSASALLLAKYTTLKPKHHAARFVMRFEDRRRTADGLVPDPKKSDFVNVIREMYDSEQDSETATENCVNANVDVQRYYSPPLDQVNDEALAKVRKLLDDERKGIAKELEELGISK